MDNNMEHDMQVAAIIARELGGETLTPREEEILREWTGRSPGNREFHESCRAGKFLEDFDRTVALSDARARWEQLHRLTRPSRSWRRQALYAASVAVLLVLGWWSWPGSGERKPLPAGETIDPARSKAILVTADGQRHVFEERDTSFSTIHSDILFSGGEMTDATGKRQTETYAGGRNLIIVPVSGIFSVTLQDGTRVFLNSASRLEYPVTFSESSREVTLEGEAFFEVASDTARPFIVHAGRVNARVLGTSFNLLAYVEEPVHELTLLSGRVEIEANDKITGLRPGTRASWEVASSRVEVKEIDPATCSLWKEGIIMLDERAMDAVARMLERWYDVHMIFEEGVQGHQHTFTGKIDMNLDLGSVLQTLTLLGGPRFEIQGRDVHVYRNVINHK
ncbi:MAG: FecR domain-containing protein [Odoribacteraceae bacterium]|jgi:ferric-dicitrate binding protein FerR (iron transport regulator)|nr:FecR domain-containing protein [Odoribacteraceae bacterium]